MRARSTVLTLLAAAALAAAPDPLGAQRREDWVHGGIGLSLLSSRGPAAYTGEQVSARGWGGIVWAPMLPSLHGYATLEGFTNETGQLPREFGVFNVVLTVPFHGAPFGLVPFVGAGLGLGGGEPGITPVLAGGSLWSRGKKGGLVPFAMVERLTSRERTTLRLGVWYGI
jgi:hypothetical protein